MAELANCPQCGRIFAKSFRQVCDACYKEEEKMFELVYKFIRKKANREASLWEVHEATGVPEKTIIRFVKEGRIRAHQLPNLAYPCERCGKNIQDGRICGDCNDRMKKDLHSHEESTQKRIQEERITYHTEK
ncbi:TIGR03826 family flagellar region protein [Bacillus sp. Marseille-Q3570]|uniref:TIGR03826 family flagellar region protein n=1 Tax=Bacillus sp. Marseille-Q3570 TaxID=2963522 RepID=UPI0021B7811A|nr:TIGR03826 family flagellar region protein [Bacillus sp. Marseille-Q3570]